MKKYFKPVGYYALGVKKGEYIKETVQPIQNISSYLFGFYGSKYAVQLSMLFPSHFFQKDMVVRYLVWLDTNKNVCRSVYLDGGKYVHISKYDLFTTNAEIISDN